MRLNLLFVFSIICLSSSLSAQTMEEKVTAYLEYFLNDNKSTMSASELSDTYWKSDDLMGGRSLFFDNKDRFKIKNDGFQANRLGFKGKWYLNKEFIVLEVKREKIPLYILKNDVEYVLVDDSQINILKQLLTEASYKDGALKPYSHEEIFTFLNGFKIQE